MLAAFLKAQIINMGYYKQIHLQKLTRLLFHLWVVAKAYSTYKYSTNTAEVLKELFKRAMSNNKNTEEMR